MGKFDSQSESVGFKAIFLFFFSFQLHSNFILGFCLCSSLTTTISIFTSNLSCTFSLHISILVYYVKYIALVLQTSMQPVVLKIMITIFY